MGAICESTSPPSQSGSGQLKFLGAVLKRQERLDVTLVAKTRKPFGTLIEGLRSIELLLPFSVNRKWQSNLLPKFISGRIGLPRLLNLF